MAHLFLFQIGPVQSFIAAGRRTQDLYVGSRILSQLSAAGFTAAQQSEGFQPVFPMWVNEESQRLPKGVPHRFAFVSKGNVEYVSQLVETAIRTYWRDEYAAKIYNFLLQEVGEGDWQLTFERQAENWLELYWAAVPYQADIHGECFANVSVAIAQRKLMRHFPLIEEPGRKCTLTGAQSALDDIDGPLWRQLKRRLHDNSDILFREHEALGSLALIKRIAQYAYCDLGMEIGYRAKSTRDIAGIDEQAERNGRQVEGYLAVLHMDGDRMGARLSGFRYLDEHQEFSRELARFSDVTVPEIVREYGGETAQLVYAGGDDVLALLPLNTVLSCANELRKQFTALTDCTASAGIAVTPYDFPLDVALDIARQAEEMAKEDYGRDAIVVTEAHGTGQIRHAGGKWGIIDLVTDLYGHFSRRELSGKLGYDLLTVASEMTGRVQSHAREAEVTRLLRRRTAETASANVKKEIENLAGTFMQHGDVIDVEADELRFNWEGVAHWTILARFLAQPTQEQM